MDIQKEFSNQFKEAIKDYKVNKSFEVKRNFTSKDLSDKTGISTPVISSLQNGRFNVSFSTFFTLLKEIGYTIELRKVK